MINVEEMNFYWVQASGSIQGLKNGEIKPLKIEAEKTEKGEKTTIEIKPKVFFTIDKTLYFSTDFQEPNPDFDPDYVPEEGEAVASQYVTVEKYFKQVKGGAVIEIEALPEQPEAERLVADDGKYKVFIADYQGQAVNDVHRLIDDRYCGRNIMVSGYFYGFSNAFNNAGAFIDIQDGLPNVRDAGLYFINDRFTSQIKVAEAGRMWVY